MVARVTQVRIKPEDIDESVRLFDESVIPAANQEAGFIGALLLVRQDGRALAIDLAETLEDAQANERSGVYQTQIAKFADRIVDHPTREFFSVRVARGQPGALEPLPAHD